MTAEHKTVSANRLRKRTPRKNPSKGFSIEEIKELEPDTVPYYVTDREGFAVRVMPSGVRTFYYKYTMNGKKDQMRLGNFVEKELPGKPLKPGVLTLKMAKDKYDELRKKVGGGTDPKATPEPEPAESTPKKSYLTMTVQELADAYIEFMPKTGNRAQSTYGEYERTINTYILPYFRAQNLVNLTDVKKSDAIDLIQRVATNVKPNGEKTEGQARAVLKIARAMFNFQIEKEDLAFRNPFKKLGSLKQLKQVMKTKKQARVLTDPEIVQLWQTLNSADGPGSASAARALMLILVTAQRPGEVTSMHRDQIDGDWWQIPAALIKTRWEHHRDHRVYLTPLAKRIIGDFQGFIFPSPSPRSKGRPISEKALTRLVNEETVTKSGVVTRPLWLGLSKKWTPNDLRKTARTKLTSLRCPKDVGEAIVNHIREEVHGTYDIYDYEEERVYWLTKWSERVECLLQEGKTDAVRLTDDSYDVRELETLVAQMPLTEVGRRLGITDNAVRKRCRKHGIPLKPQGHWLNGRPRGW